MRAAISCRKLVSQACSPPKQAYIRTQSADFAGQLPALHAGPDTIWGIFMKHTVIATALLLSAVVSAQASPGRNRLICRADVLHSEELTFSPIYYHLVSADLLIVPPDGQAFQTTVEKMMPWQAPPPRQGQKFKFRCDSEAWRNLFR
jgi:hypothetical protein